MKNDILRVFFVNIIRMLVALFAVFLLPAVLDINSYAYVKLYQLYVSYIGLLHLGYCDGIYLKYGGKNLGQKIKNIAIDLRIMKAFQALVTIIVIIIGFYFKDFIIILWGITIYPRNLRTFYEYMYQATGEFKKYSQLVNTYSFALIIFYIFSILIFKIQVYQIYIIGLCSVDIITCVIGKIMCKEMIRVECGKGVIKRFIYNIRLGFFLMLGNFANTLFLSIDKWFVKICLGLNDFAYYSFATQILLLINLFITPITMTFFNYFSKKKNKEFERLMYIHLISIIFIMLAFTFGVNQIITWFIPKYKESLNIIAILFLSQIFSSINAAIFLNLYKAYKKQQQYFINVCFIIILSIILNFSFFYIEKSIESFAYATLVCTIVMWLINIYRFKHLKLKIREIILIMLSIILYSVLLKIEHYIFSFFLYSILYIALLFILKKNELKYWMRQLEECIVKCKKKFERG